MPRHLVFLGNCQTAMLAGLYRDAIAAETGERVSYHPSYEAADAAAARDVAEADVLVRQVLDFAPATEGLRSRARVVLVPMVSASFLWPCAGRPHPRNAPAPGLDEAGPYGAELGDAFLDDLIARGVETEAAVAAYRDADIARLRRVERMREIMLDRQAARDAASGGYGFAALIGGRIGAEKLFRTAHHPERGLALRLAAEAFARLGATPAQLDAMAAHAGPLFPETEMPIHPSVARHFGLAYADATTRYRYFDEGGFTAEEFARRYLGYVWNPDLPLGMRLAYGDEPAEAEPVLRRALAASPRSAVGHAVLADLMARAGRLTEAAALIGEAVRLDPGRAHFRAVQGHFHDRLAQEPGRMGTGDA